MVYNAEAIKLSLSHMQEDDQCDEIVNEVLAQLEEKERKLLEAETSHKTNSQRSARSSRTSTSSAAARATISNKKQS